MPKRKKKTTSTHYVTAFHSTRAPRPPPGWSKAWLCSPRWPSQPRFCRAAACPAWSKGLCPLCRIGSVAPAPEVDRGRSQQAFRVATGDTYRSTLSVRLAQRNRAEESVDALFAASTRRAPLPFSFDADVRSRNKNFIIR